MTIIVPPGVSGRQAKHDTSLITHDHIANELALMTLGPFEPLNTYIDCGKFMQEIEQFDTDWVDYLPRTDRPNNRKALTVTNMHGKSHRDAPSMPQVRLELGRKISELEFCEPTDVYRQCTSLHAFLDQWNPLGRTFLVRSDIGGYFVPHRDHPSIPRETFRLVVFLNNCGPLQYDWLMDDRKMNIREGQVYYVNTRMTHRTISWVDNSIHLILNIPFTTENVAKVISNLAHTH
jgi:hypothetical protein